MRRKSRARTKRAAVTANPPDRVRHLIAIDAANVMRRLDARAAEMVALFSRLRDRAPMLETVHAWFESAGFAEPAEQAVVNAFHEELGELRWYFQYTEDMPGTVQTTTAARLKRLHESHARLEAVIGAPQGKVAPAVEVEIVVHPPEPPIALPAAKKS
jgi:hypothetical protein